MGPSEKRFSNIHKDSPKASSSPGANLTYLWSVCRKFKKQKELKEEESRRHSDLDPTRKAPPKKQAKESRLVRETHLLGF